MRLDNYFVLLQENHFNVLVHGQFVVRSDAAAHAGRVVDIAADGRERDDNRVDAGRGVDVRPERTEVLHLQSGVLRRHGGL